MSSVQSVSMFSTFVLCDITVPSSYGYILTWNTLRRSIPVGRGNINEWITECFNYAPANTLQNTYKMFRGWQHPQRGNKKKHGHFLVICFMAQSIDIMPQNFWQMRYNKIYHNLMDTFLYLGGCVNIEILFYHFGVSIHTDKTVSPPSYNISFRCLSARLQYLHC